MQAAACHEKSDHQQFSRCWRRFAEASPVHGQKEQLGYRRQEIAIIDHVAYCYVSEYAEAADTKREARLVVYGVKSMFPLAKSDSALENRGELDRATVMSRTLRSQKILCRE